MIFQTKSGNIKKIGFYQTEKKPKTWQRYADVLIPLVTLPLLLIIALYLNSINADRAIHPEVHKWDICLLSSAMLIISFLVFVYICIRLSAILGGRTRLRLPMIRSNRSDACFLKSVNSDLHQYMTPLNSSRCHYTYESIIFDFPPYDKPEKKNTDCEEGQCMTV